MQNWHGWPLWEGAPPGLPLAFGAVSSTPLSGVRGRGGRIINRSRGNDRASVKAPVFPEPRPGLAVATPPPWNKALQLLLVVLSQMIPAKRGTGV